MGVHPLLFRDLALHEEFVVSGVHSIFVAYIMGEIGGIGTIQGLPFVGVEVGLVPRDHLACVVVVPGLAFLLDVLVLLPDELVLFDVLVGLLLEFDLLLQVVVDESAEQPVAGTALLLRLHTGFSPDLQLGVFALLGGFRLGLGLASEGGEGICVLGGGGGSLLLPGEGGEGTEAVPETLFDVLQLIWEL